MDKVSINLKYFLTFLVLSSVIFFAQFLVFETSSEELIYATAFLAIIFLVTSLVFLVKLLKQYQSLRFIYIVIATIVFLYFVLTTARSLGIF